MARYFPNNGAPGAPVHFPPGGRFEAKSRVVVPLADASG